MKILNRRKFLSLLSVSAAIPTLTLVQQSTVLASDLPLVKAESEQATKLSYMLVSQTEGKSCRTCALYQGDTEAKTGTCPLFAGSSVSTDAVCSAWSLKS